MSMGWMMQVAPMPLRPPLTNGLATFHTEELWLSDDMLWLEQEMRCSN
jgi:hypothetical protein